MVDEFKKILSTMISEKGEVTFLGIFKMDDITDKWSVILSAPWVEESKEDDGFRYLRNLMSNSLSPEQSSSIARIGIFSEDEHLLKLLLEYKTGTRIQDEKVNGNMIHDGYIFASRESVNKI